MAKAMTPNFPQPTCNPPGGGSWIWNTATGAWFEKSDAPENVIEIIAVDAVAATE